MLIKVNGNIIKVDGRFPSYTQDSDIVFNLTVQGTCFPARRVDNTTAYFRVYSEDNVDNTVYINYNDGTGEYAYPFKASGTSRIIYFTNRGSQYTPATVPGNSTYDQIPLHFYQDLPDGVKDTVNNDYAQQRVITIRFEKAQSITNIIFSGFIVFGIFPSAVSQLKNLKQLTLNALLELTGFAQDFVNPRMEEFTASTVGEVFSNGFANWMLTSEYLRILNLNGAVNLSGSAESKKFNQINKLKDTLTYLDVGHSELDYRIPEEFGELYKLQNFQFISCPDPNIRFPEDISGLAALTLVRAYGTKMPFEETERIMRDLPVINNIDIAQCNYNEDHDLAEPNPKITTIYIGSSNTWNNRAVPTFISRLPNLQVLDMSHTGYSSGVTDGLRSYGDFSACTALRTVSIAQQENFVTTIPAWFNALVSLKTFQCFGTFLTLARMDEFVNNFYAFITDNASMAAGNTAFRQMAVDTYGTSVILQDLEYRPSGTYQQPAGYIAGADNGAPASPMEKVWVMTNQYGHIWTVKPA